MADEIQSYYNAGKEQSRLGRGIGPLEATRTQEILRRFLPENGTILDIGGGTGPYAFWLAGLGYQVHLIDIIALHIQQALAAQTADATLASATVGDARSLEFDDASADAALLLGPLYHLTERADRIAALREAYRVLKPGGVLIAAVISRYASMMATVVEDRLDYQPFIEVVERDLQDGQHRNATGNITFFTTAYFHEPSEVQDEIETAGFQWETTLMVEGPGWVAPDFEAIWANPTKREQILKFARQTETTPALMGMSPHLIGVGYK